MIDTGEKHGERSESVFHKLNKTDLYLYKLEESAHKGLWRDFIGRPKWHHTIETKRRMDTPGKIVSAETKAKQSKAALAYWARRKPNEKRKEDTNR